LHRLVDYSRGCRELRDSAASSRFLFCYSRRRNYGFFGAGAGREFAGGCAAGAGVVVAGALDCGTLDGAVVCGLPGVTGVGLGAGLETFSSTEPPCSTPLST